MICIVQAVQQQQRPLLTTDVSLTLLVCLHPSSVWDHELVCSPQLPGQTRPKLALNSVVKRDAKKHFQFMLVIISSQLARVHDPSQTQHKIIHANGYLYITENIVY